MNILICINSLSKAGAQRVVSNLANYLSKKHDITIMTYTNFKVEYFLQKNIKVVKLDKKEKSAYTKRSFIQKIIVRPFNVLMRTVKMRKEIDKINPDIIVSFLPEPSFLVLFNKKFNKKKVIVAERNDPKNEYNSILYKYLMRKLYPKADGLVFMTREAKEYFNGIINCETKIIKQAVSQEFIEKTYEGKRKKEIVAVGRLTKQKNFEMLIDAFSMLGNKFNDYKLIIYGEGEQRKFLEGKIQKLKLQDRVFLPGIVENIKKQIYESSIYVLPSNYEGICNSLVEAMCMGLPVIATDCPSGGSRELIKNNINGILIGVNNTIELKEKMEELLNNSNKCYMLGKAASKLSNELMPDIIYAQWEEFIEEIANDVGRKI